MKLKELDVVELELLKENGFTHVVQVPLDDQFILSPGNICIQYIPTRGEEDAKKLVDLLHPDAFYMEIQDEDIYECADGVRGAKFYISESVV